MSKATIQLRETLASDVDGVVALFCEGGHNPYNWSTSKWEHHYLEYPEGQTVSLVAVLNGRVVAHYGLVPVRVGPYRAMLGQHAYVAADQRGLSVLSLIMRMVDAKCKELGIDFICGFANPEFTYIKSKIFKWHTLCWLGFKNGFSEQDLINSRNRKHYFNYSSKWYEWRFGEERDQYLSQYVDSVGVVRKQLLKTTDRSDARVISDAEAWAVGNMFSSQPSVGFCQPFSLKIYNDSLLRSELLDIDTWCIEMGDSDTFRYTPWEQSK